MTMEQVETVSDEKARRKKEKKEKKKKKKASRSASPPPEAASEQEPVVNDESTSPKKKKKKRSREERKREKEEAMSKVPQVDQDGIAYTKLQTRRMIKRVKRGLSPVPTEAEEQERRRNENQLRREEEEELAGIIYKKEEEEDDDDDDNGDDDPNGDAEEDQEEDDQLQNSNREASKENDDVCTPAPPTKKSKRSKPVPPDYICQACKNKHQPAHWIYDCPQKVTVRGTNQKRKKERGFVEPDSKKVFVSGLPFDVKSIQVEQLFSSCGKVANCRLIKFEDTGRCKGQAYIGFETEESALKALKLSGTPIDEEKLLGKKSSKKKKSSTPTKRKDLKLSVSKMLGRRTTKRTVTK